MAVVGGAGVEGAVEAEAFDDGSGAAVELGGEAGGEGVVAGAASIDVPGHGPGDADGVGDLNLGGGGEAFADELARDPAGEVGGGAINLGRVFAGEGSAAVAGVATIGIHNYLTPGEAAVALGAAYDKFAGGVDVGGDAWMVPGAERLGEEDVANPGMDFGLGFAGGVLGGNDDGFHGDGARVFVADGDLGFCVGAEPGLATGPAVAVEGAGNGVREGDGEGQKLGSLGAGKAEHVALVAGSLVEAGADAAGDVGRLGAEQVDDAQAVGVEGEGGVGVAELAHGGADEGLGIDADAGGDLAGEDDGAVFDECLDGDARGGVLSKVGVEQGVGEEIGDLVGVAGADGFGGEESGEGGVAHQAALLSAQAEKRGAEMVASGAPAWAARWAKSASRRSRATATSDVPREERRRMLLNGPFRSV